MPLGNAEFSYIRKLVLDEAAIALEENKDYLVESRLLPVARDLGLTTIAQLVAKLRENGADRLRTKVVEAMTTNETSFFRDLHPFLTLKKEILPRIIEAKRSSKQLTIWCAASSSGQEPYTILLILKENFPELSQWKVRMICSDISEEMLARTKAGVFTQLEVNRGLPAPLLIKYFKQDATSWQVKEELRKMLEVRKINLAADWPVLPRCDLIFMRNVMIYFTNETKKDILNRVHNTLASDGYLFLGTTESTFNIDDRYERVQFDKTVCYQSKSNAKFPRS